LEETATFKGEAYLVCTPIFQNRTKIEPKPPPDLPFLKGVFRLRFFFYFSSFLTAVAGDPENTTAADHLNKKSTGP
jgi:hypothetical protein